MTSKTLFLTLLGLAALAVPAAVPASQPIGQRSGLLPVVATTPAAGHLATLLADPYRPAGLVLVPPTPATTLDWIDQDPFAP